MIGESLGQSLVAHIMSKHTEGFIRVQKDSVSVPYWFLVA